MELELGWGYEELGDELTLRKIMLGLGIGLGLGLGLGLRVGVQG
jgi:hypothetical protein